MSRLHGSNLLFHLNHWLMVSYCDHWMSVVRCQSCVADNCLKGQLSPNLLAGFRQNLEGMILLWPSLIIDQMPLVHCIFRPLRLKQIFESLGMWHNLVDLNQGWPLTKWALPGGHV